MATLSRGRERLGSEAGAAELILRAYEVQARAEVVRWFDVGLSYGAQDWYVQVDPPGRSWFVEIGWRGPSGRFIPLAKSNIAKTPPEGCSDRIDEEWGILSEAWPASWTGPGLSSGHSPGSLWGR